MAELNAKKRLRAPIRTRFLPGTRDNFNIDDNITDATSFKNQQSMGHCHVLLKRDGTILRHGGIVVACSPFGTAGCLSPVRGEENSKKNQESYWNSSLEPRERTNAQPTRI